MPEKNLCKYYLNMTSVVRTMIRILAREGNSRLFSKTSTLIFKINK